MRKIAKYTVCAVLVFILFIQSVSALSIPKTCENIEDVIVKTHTEPINTVKYIQKLYPQAEISYIYDALFFGFSAKVPASLVDKIKNLHSVQSVYSSVEYTSPNDNENAVRQYESFAFTNLSVSREYRGKGIVVSVLDTGFDYEDPYFCLNETDGIKIDHSDYRELKLRSSLPGKYISEKIPYIYDYADKDEDVGSENLHGQHVAGIIAANSSFTKDSNFNGVSPEAQLLLMKVFSDESGYTTSSAIIKAIEDSVKLGADVINMSFGSPCGNKDGYPMSYSLIDAIDAAKAAGTMVICASGNDGTNGNGYYYDLEYGINDLPVNVVDTSAVTSPASYTESFAVGSYAELYTVSYAFKLGAAMFPYCDHNHDYEINGQKACFAEHMGKYVRYRVIPDTAEYDDFKEVKGLGGALAVVPFGDPEENIKRTEYAEEFGAVGLIMYCDEMTDATMIVPDLTDYPLPVILIDHSEYEMISASKLTYMQFSDQMYEFVPDSNIFLSEFSSCGAVGYEIIKPEVIAPGESIISLGDGGLTEKSGTSMSSAFVSGFCAALIQARRDQKLPCDPATLEAVIMNSSVPLVDSESGIEYSPRIQGAGAVDFDSAINNKVILKNRDGKGKIELGNSISYIFNFELEIKNTSNTPADYYLSSLLFSDAYYGMETEAGTIEYFNKRTPKGLSNSRVFIGNSANTNSLSENSDKYKLRVEPNYTRKVTVTVFLDAGEMSELESVFKYGFYIDGYIKASDKNGNVLASIPFTGFCNGEEYAPIFEKTLYDEEHGYFESTFLYTYLQNGDELFFEKLGKYDGGEDIVYAYEYLSFSPNGDGMADEVYASFGIYENLSSVNWIIKNNKGDTVYTSGNMGKVTKSRKDGFMLINSEMKLWDGRDNEGRLCPDGAYTIEIYATGINSERTEKLEYPVVIDTVSPRTVNYMLRYGKNGNVYLDFKFRDGYALRSAVCISEGDDDGSSKFSVVKGFGGVVNESKQYTVSVNITFMNTDELTLRVYDYAYNELVYTVDISDIYRLMSEDDSEEI